MTPQHRHPDTGRNPRSRPRLSGLLGPLRRLCPGRRRPSDRPDRGKRRAPQTDSGQQGRGGHGTGDAPLTGSGDDSTAREGPAGDSLHTPPAADCPPDRQPTSGETAGGPAGGGDVARERLRAARLWVATHRPYYAEALFSCPVVITEEVERFGITPPWTIFANPHIGERLPIEQLAGLFIHEINHALRGHVERGRRLGVPPQNMMVWNYAADFEINDDLAADLAAAGVPLPELIFPEDLDMEPGQLAEAYYQQILDNAIPVHLIEGCCESAGGGPDFLHPHSAEGCSESGGDSDFPVPRGEEGLDPARREQLRRRTAQAVADHEREAGAGSVPVGLARWAGRRTATAADWRRILAAELRKGIHRRPGAGDWTWTRPPRRPDPDNSPLLRPDTTRSTADIAVVIDTSGSMKAKDHAQAVAEVDAILTRAVPGEAVAVYSFDTQTQAAQTVQSARRVRLAGGGGTDMEAGIHTAAQARPRPAVIIVITDGYTLWPPARPASLTAAVIAVLTIPGTAQHVPQWITSIQACAPSP